MYTACVRYTFATDNCTSSEGVLALHDVRGNGERGEERTARENRFISLLMCTHVNNLT